MAAAKPGDFGTLLRRFRRLNALSQEALAERAGVSVQAVGALECGLRRAPYPRTVDAIATALGLSSAERTALERAAAGDRLRRSVRARERRGATGEPRHNLPATAGPLVGRARQSARLGKVLEGKRLVTVVGPGGIGKTRLALAVAHRVRSRFPDGAWFCDLAPLADAGLVTATVAAACGLPADAGNDPLAALEAGLGTSVALVVLDNCEHVARAASDVAARIVARCPGVAVLATSRAPLHAADETIYPLAPLALSSAVDLFAQRAAAVRPGFVLAAADAGYAEEICRRMDGIPLAIELAAAQVRVMSAREVLRLLDRRHALRLPAGNGARAARHETLASVFDWSYQLLPEAVRARFRALGAFAGDFTFEGFEAVCCDAGVAELDALASLSALCDASLAIAQPSDGDTRYRLLETTRAYAAERLAESGEHDAVAARHLAYVLQRAEDPEAHVEIDELRGALRWALGGGDVARGAALAASVGIRWEKMGLAAEGVAYLEAAIDAVPDDPQLLSRLWAALSFLRGNALQYEPAFAASEQALRHARRAPRDDAALFNALRSFAIFAAWQRRFDEAAAALREAEEIAGRAPSRQNDLRLAFAVAQLEKARGAPAAATEAFERARRLSRELSDGYREVSAVVQLAELAHECGETGRAIALLRTLRTERRLDPVDDGPVLTNLAGYLAATGDVAGCRACLRDFCAIGPEAAASVFLGALLDQCALAEAIAGNVDLAARLGGFCAAWYASRNIRRQFTEQRARDRLDALLGSRLRPRTLERLAAEGAGLAAQTAVAEALAAAMGRDSKDEKET
jgi:predicted ATPase/DNA-binding XRE family transcriptional regulator